MKNTRWLIVVMFGLILLAPAAQMVLRLVPEPELTGFTSRAELFPLNWRNWSTGKFQARFDLWLRENIGFRAVGIRTDSQINFSLFNESAIKTADVPVIGRDGFLYARAYIDAYNRRKGSPLRSAANFAADIRRLQDILLKRGKAFVMVISPSKAEIYPENIPSRFLSPSTRMRESDYQLLLPALQKEGVRFVDGHAIFLERKCREKWLLFPPGGIHWQEYGAWHVLDRVLTELETQLNRSLVRPTCDTILSDITAPEKGEADIAAVLNVWKPPQWPQILPRPRFSQSTEKNAFRPDFLLVGDSFVFGLINLINSQRICRNMDMYYYFSTLYQYPSGIVKKLNKSKIDWEDDVFSKDAVVLEINEILLDSKSWGFVKNALEYLDKGTRTDLLKGSRPDGH